MSPGNAWEYAQRGIHRQDDFEDIAGAIADYRESLALNSLSDGSCQIVTSVPAQDFGKLDPPPCMFTVRLRLGYLLMRDSPEDAISLFQEVLQIDPQRLEVNSLLGEAYAISASRGKNGSERRRLYKEAKEYMSLRSKRKQYVVDHKANTLSKAAAAATAQDRA